MASNKPVLHGRDHLPGGPDPIGFDFSIATQLEYLDATCTAAANTTATFDFAHSSGAALLDLVTIGSVQPQIPANGLYLIAAQVVTTVNVSVTRTVKCGMTIASTETVFASDSFTADSTHAAVGEVSFAKDMQLLNGDALQCFATNYDSVSHDFTMKMTVTFIA